MQCFFLLALKFNVDIMFVLGVACMHALFLIIYMQLALVGVMFKARDFMQAVDFTGLMQVYYHVALHQACWLDQVA